MFEHKTGSVYDLVVEIGYCIKLILLHIFG